MRKSTAQRITHLNISDKPVIHELLLAFIDNMYIIVSLFLSGQIDLSYIDPVVIGRSVFNTTNEFMCRVVGCVRDVLCAILDAILAVVKGTYSHHLTSVTS